MPPPVSPEAITAEISASLREERLRQGLSQNEVAKRARLSHTMVMRVEKQERLPTIDTLLRITNALGIDLSDVIREATLRVKKVASKPASHPNQGT